MIDTDVNELGPSWHGTLRATVEKYDPADVDVWVEKRRKPGVVGFCQRRARVTQHRVHDGAEPVEVVTSLHNLLLNAGITRMLNLMCGLGGQAWDAAHSRIGVGNDATAAVATQTDLQAAAGAANRQFKLVSSGPTVSGQTVSWVATFAGGEAQFPWQEFMLDQGTADGTVVAPIALNRKVTNNGTKAAAVWVMTLSLVLS